MKDEKNTGFIVYDFMKEDMGLGGVALQVYALIYSFTKAGSACHGSINYIADRTKSSTASVQRALNFLVEKDYVTKRKISSKRPSIYTANLDSINQNDSITNESINHDDSMIQSKCEYDTIKMIDNNKDNNKEDNNLLTNHSFFQGEQDKNGDYRFGRSDVSRCEQSERGLPREAMRHKSRRERPIQPFGKERLVMMTLHQYANLLKAVGVLPTLRYIGILERQILRYPERDYPNHYQTIITWARQDGYIMPEGEEILRN